MTISYFKGKDNRIFPQCVVTLLAILSSFMSGIHYGWSSPMVPKLVDNNFSLDITLDEASYIVTIAAVGDIIGPIICYFLIDSIGRKWSLFLTTSLHLPAMIMIYFCSKSIVFLYVGRILGGTAEGSSWTLLPIYICEISEPRVRGVLTASSVLSFYLGLLCVNLIGYSYSIETTALITLIFPLIFLITFGFVPESPYYLLMKNNAQKGEKSLKMLRWNSDVDEELHQIETDVKKQMSEEGRWQDLILIRSNRISLTICVVLTFMQLFNGATSVTVYAQSFFSETTKALSEEWAAVVIIILQFIVSCVATAVTDYVGRRILLLLSTLGCSVVLILLMIYFIIRDYTAINIEQNNWIVLMLIMLLIILYSVGLGSVVNVVYGELFSTSVKGKGICATFVFYGVCMFGSTKMYQYLTDYYSMCWAFLIFAVIQFSGFGFCWLMLPETKGKTLDEIQNDLKLWLKTK